MIYEVYIVFILSNFVVDVLKGFKGSYDMESKLCGPFQGNTKKIKEANHIVVAFCIFMGI